MTYVPDEGETFSVSNAWSSRRRRHLPWPRRSCRQTHHCRVTGGLRRRQPPPLRSEREQQTREILEQSRAEGKLPPPVTAGPDRVPLEWCRREDAEYVCGTGAAGVIVRLGDLVLDGRAATPDYLVASQRRLAEQRAGEPQI